MDRLSPAHMESLRRALDSCKEQWLLACSDLHVESALTGPVGYFDWRLRGQVSRLLARGELPPDRPCIVSGHGKLGQAKLLLVPTGSLSPAKLVSHLKSLAADSIALEESGFSGDFLAKLKDNLSKEQIRWSTLDWRTH